MGQNEEKERKMTKMFHLGELPLLDKENGREDNLEYYLDARRQRRWDRKRGFTGSDDLNKIVNLREDRFRGKIIKR